jgi:hypothetical protein
MNETSIGIHPARTRGSYLSKSFHYFNYSTVLKTIIAPSFYSGRLPAMTTYRMKSAVDRMRGCIFEIGHYLPALSTPIPALSTRGRRLV